MTSTGPRLVLHVGAMKTGTTYLQGRLVANADALAAHGWWVPERSRSNRAVREVLGFAAPPPAPREPRWSRLMEKVAEHGADGGRGAVVSMEFLSYAKSGQVPGILETARAAGLRVQVVITVRDAVRALPAQWLTLVRNQHSLSWSEFVEGARHEERRSVGRAQFRRTQDLPRILRAWASEVAPEALSVVTVPGPGHPRDLLWERFVGLLGVAPAAVPAVAAFDNPQLGYGSCELLRRVNAAGLDREDGGRYRKVVRGVTHDLVDELRAGQSKPRLDGESASFAVELNRRSLEVIARRATLVGAPEDLPTELATHPVRDELDPGSTPAPPPEGEVLRAAAVFHGGLVAWCAAQGLVLPAEVGAAPPADLPGAVDAVARVLAVAVTGDVSHRPSPRPRPEGPPPATSM